MVQRKTSGHNCSCVSIVEDLFTVQTEIEWLCGSNASAFFRVKQPQWLVARNYGNILCHFLKPCRTSEECIFIKLARKNVLSIIFFIFQKILYKLLAPDMILGCKLCWTRLLSLSISDQRQTNCIIRSTLSCFPIITEYEGYTTSSDTVYCSICSSQIYVASEMAIFSSAL